MNIFESIARFFGKDNNASSRTVAKERLRLVLVHDRADIDSKIMDSLREDLITVIGKYMEIDNTALDVTLSREDGSVALIASIPVIKVKRTAT